MKTMVLTLFASVIMMTTATAQKLTPNEIFSAIDGEYNHTEDSMLVSPATQRVNFDISADHSALLDSALLDNVLSGVDSEYDASSWSGTRINYSMEAIQGSESSMDSNVLSHVLSGIDAEYKQ